MIAYLKQDDCISKLGKRMQNLRCDRPDEWAMDDFIRDADNMQKEIDELKNKLELYIEKY